MVTGTPEPGGEVIIPGRDRVVLQRVLLAHLDEAKRIVNDEALTTDERRAVSRHRGELVTLVRYCRNVVVT